MGETQYCTRSKLTGLPGFVSPEQNVTFFGAIEVRGGIFTGALYLPFNQE